jgi:hypothetical protein
MIRSRAFRIIAAGAILLIGAGQAFASMRDDLKGETLVCAGGSQIKFNSSGSRAIVVSPGGTKTASLVWHPDHVELYFPGAQDSLAVSLSGSSYTFQGAQCQ